MAGNGKRSLRLVVQRRLEAHALCYRLVAYGDGAVYRPLDFPSPAEVIKSLRPLLPNLQEGELASIHDSPHTQIVFTADIVADDEQLRRVGLTNRR